MISGNDPGNVVEYQDEWFQRLSLALATHHGGLSDVDGGGRGRKWPGVCDTLELVLPGCFAGWDTWGGLKDAS